MVGHIHAEVANPTIPLHLSQMYLNIRDHYCTTIIQIHFHRTLWCRGSSMFLRHPNNLCAGIRGRPLLILIWPVTGGGAPVTAIVYVHSNMKLILSDQHFEHPSWESSCNDSKRQKIINTPTPHQVLKKKVWVFLNLSRGEAKGVMWIVWGVLPYYSSVVVGWWISLFWSSESLTEGKRERDMNQQKMLCKRNSIMNYAVIWWGEIWQKKKINPYLFCFVCFCVKKKRVIENLTVCVSQGIVFN